MKTLVRAAKRSQELRVARLCKKNPKEFFSYVNSRKTISKKIGPLADVDGNLHSSNDEMAVLLNDHFSSVFTVENDLHPRQPEPVSDIFNYVRCTPEEVEERIAKLDRFKSPGADGFLPRVVKEVKHAIVPHITSIFNVSLETGVVPRDWREANVTPIFKKGSSSQPGNYRPVNPPQLFANSWRVL